MILTIKCLTRSKRVNLQLSANRHTVRDLGVDIEDALVLADGTEV